MKVANRDYFKDDNSLQTFWNVVKGIGIVSIVIGHSCGTFPKVVRFVYLYHLSIFFFVSGFLYSEKKYGDAPYINVGARLRSLWPKYVCYMGVYILLHNVFLKCGIVLDAPAYGIGDIIVAMVASVTFLASETMGGALWFVPVFIVASGLFGCIIYMARTAERLSGKTWCKYMTAVILTVLTGAIGVYTNRYGMYFVWHIQTSFVVVPLLTIAWLIGGHRKKWYKCLHWAPGIAACALMIYGIRNWGWAIELSANIIGHPVGFYAVSILGIYFCLVLAKYLLYIPGLKSIMSLLGRYSFDIMAGHFLALKLVDVIYARLMQETNIQAYGIFPTAYSHTLWPVYIAAGLLLPTVIALGFSHLTKRLLSSKTG